MVLEVMVVIVVVTVHLVVLEVLEEPVLLVQVPLVVIPNHRRDARTVANH
jgi:hypothetical protein